MEPKRLWSLFLPDADTVSVSEKALSGLAGFAGILLIMLCSSLFLAPVDLPWVVASMGASAVLLFAVPLGPLSQPWNFVGGHLLSAVIGITTARLVPDLASAAAIAVSLAIFVMYLTRCLHPPGGATALTAVVGGASVQALGYRYILTPVLLNVAVMLSWALLVNNLMPNRYYPNTLKRGEGTRAAKGGRPEAPGLAIARTDLEFALREMKEFIDVSEDDLVRIYNLSATHARRKRMGEVLCRDIMTSPVVSAEYGTDVESVWRLMGQHRIRAVPIIDGQRRVIGILTVADFLSQVKQPDGRRLHERLESFLKRTRGMSTDKPEYAGHLMTRDPVTVPDDRHILDLFAIFYQRGMHHIPVVDDAGRLLGMITPKDLLSSLHDDATACA